MPSVFIDTNVLIYLRDPAFPTKAERARDWLKIVTSRNEAVISLQVINEFVSVSLRRFASVPPGEIYERARVLGRWCTAPYDLSIAFHAMSVQERYGLAWWDALIVASAVAAGCRYVLTEDMQAGARLGDLRIVNPFETDPTSLLRS